VTASRPLRNSALLAAFALVACAPLERDDLRISISLAADTCGVASADATVTAPDMAQVGPVPLVVVAGSIQGRIAGVPAGTGRTVTVRAYAGGAAAVYEGSTVVDVVAGQAVAAQITLHRTTVACGAPATGDIDVTGTVSSGPPAGGGADMSGPDLAFTATDAFLATDGTLFLLDAADRIRRIDLDARAVLPALAGSGDAVAMAVAPDGTVAYLAYTGGRIEVFDVATGTRTFFAAAPATVSSMVVTGGYLFTIDDSGAWDTQALFHRATGARVSAADWRDTSRSMAFSPLRSRVYFLDSGVSPTDVNMVDLDLVAGTVGPETDSPYHGDYSLPNPLRLLPDESGVIVGSGLVFDAGNLSYRTAIGLAFDDIAFLGDRLYLVDAVGETTQLVTLSAGFEILAAETYPGQPLRLFAHAGGLVLLSQGATSLEVRFIAP